jgi:CelD/BcsL family acetyltransferase involved in cellulose biosynthesis
MTVAVIPASALTDGHRHAWRELQNSNPSLGSPFFSPEFTDAVARVRDGVDVAVFTQRGHVLAFAPFQRVGASVGVPVGDELSDYHGVIGHPAFVWDPRALLKRCRLSVWDFHHVPVSQAPLTPYFLRQGVSPQIDLSRGYDAYAADRRASGSDVIGKCATMMRRIERDVGPLTFVRHSADQSDLHDVLAWKSRQYVESSKPDLFASPHRRQIIERIHATQTERFAGVLSTLRAGDRLIAGHIGMRSRTNLHYWFPSYDPEMARYSPGLLLLLKMAQDAGDAGITTIDLGLGTSLYKDRLMNASVALAGGTVSVPSWITLRRAARRRLRSLVLKTPLEALGRRIGRMVESRHRLSGP